MWFRIFLFPAQREVDVDSVDVGEEEIVFDFHRFFRWARRGAWFTLETQHGVTSNFFFFSSRLLWLFGTKFYLLSLWKISFRHTHAHTLTHTETHAMHTQRQGSNLYGLLVFDDFVWKSLRVLLVVFVFKWLNDTIRFKNSHGRNCIWKYTNLMEF